MNNDEPEVYDMQEDEYIKTMRGPLQRAKRAAEAVDAQTTFIDTKGNVTEEPTADAEQGGKMDGLLIKKAGKNKDGTTKHIVLKSSNVGEINEHLMTIINRFANSWVEKITCHKCAKQGVTTVFYVNNMRFAAESIAKITPCLARMATIQKDIAEIHTMRWNAEQCHKFIHDVVSVIRLELTGDAMRRFLNEKTDMDLAVVALKTRILEQLKEKYYTETTKVKMGYDDDGNEIEYDGVNDADIAALATKKKKTKKKPGKLEDIQNESDD